MNIFIQKNIGILAFFLIIFSSFQNINAQSCVNSVSTSYFSFDAEGDAGEVYLDVPDECESYQVYSNESWIYVWVDYYEKMIGIWADPNTSESSRTGYVIIDDYHYITIDQDAGCSQLPSPGTISGVTSICYGGSSNFSISPVTGATLYHWYLNGNIVSQYTTTATISFGSISSSPATITVCAYNACGEGLFSTKQITVIFSPSGGSISGTQTICYNSNASLLSNASLPSGGSGSYSYQWQSSTDGNITWNNVSGATSTSYDPPVITVPTNFRRKVIDNSGCGVAYSNVLSVSFYSTLSAGVISGNNTSCYQYPAGTITSSSPATYGSGSYTYAWEKSTNSGSTWVSAGGNTTSLDPGNLSVTTWYKRKVTDGCNLSAYSNIVIKTVRAQLIPGTISQDETLCYNGNPANITATSASGGTNSYTYSWEKSENAGANWILVQTGSANYDPPSLLITTQYRRKVTDTQCGSAYSNIVTKSIRLPLSGGTITNTNPSTICSNSEASILNNATLASGGTNSFTYQWQSSINNSTWNNIQGANSISYDPPTPLTNTYYRRMATDNGGCSFAYSNTAIIHVYSTLSAGVISGNNTSCYQYPAGTITSSSPATYGSGSYTYAWEKSTNSGSTWVSAGGNTTSLDPGNLSVTTWYKRKVTDGCNLSAYSNIVIKTVRAQLIPGTISQDETLCYNGNPANITATSASGGTNSYTYSWEMSQDEGISYNPLGVYSETYDPPNLIINTKFQRIVTDSECGTANSNVVTKSIRLPLSGGTITNTNPSTICSNSEASILNNASLASGGTNSFTYQWESSTDTTPWDNIVGATSVSYDPPTPLVKTYYRRKATDNGGCGVEYSNTVTIQIYSTLTAGAISGDYTTNISNGYVGPITNSGSAEYGSGSYTYSWEMSANGIDSWANAGGNTADLDLSYLYTTTYYRRKVTDNICGTTAYTNTVVKRIIADANYLSGESIPDPETRVLNTSNLVGTTNGSLNVNAIGGATYSIPLELLPGVNGLSPNLSLVYSSSSGPGFAGYGWQIGGISLISRGPQTVYHDGVAKGVDLSINDRFYIDGQRLVNTSYSYGDANAQYQTENDIFSRVTPQSTDTYGPSWFKTETKTGLIYEYGNSNESKQILSGYSQVVNWYVSKVSDLFGNHVDFSYIQDHNSIYPAEITYGPNTITFYYKSRLDKNFSFLKGTKIEQWLLLDKITIKYNSNIVKTYEFKHSYQGSYYNSYSILNEVIEYGIGGSRLNSTAVSYQTPSNVSFSQTSYNTTDQYINYNSLLRTGDFNGDGKADFLCLPTDGSWTGLKIYFSDGNDNFSTSLSNNTSIDIARLRDIRVIDLNSDGIDDILYEYRTTTTSSTSTFYYMLCTGSTIASPVSTGATQTYNIITGLTGKTRRTIDRQEDDNEHSANGRVRPSTLSSPKCNKSIDADYNGDGVNDIFINNSSGNWVIYSFANATGQLTSSLNTLSSGTISTLAGNVLSGDFNGDGKSDIWSFENTGVNIYTFTGATLSLLYNSNWPTNKHFFNLGDFNADGKVDVFLYGYGKGETEYDWANWQLQLSTGVGFEVHYIPQKKSNLKDDNVRAGDFNGDGATDIMVNSLDLSWTGTYFYITKNNGTDFYTNNLPAYPSASHMYYLADYNGDGQTDFICTDGVSPWWTGYQVYKTLGNNSILMEKISNGLGSLTKLVYTKLSQASSTLYQRGTGAVFPVTDFQGPLPVVSSVQLDNGKGTMNTQNYYYEGAKIHIQGKGFLGYAKTISTDVEAGMESESIFGYSTTYYYPKLLQTSSRRRNFTETLQLVNNTYSEIVLDAAKKRIFPYVQTSTQSNSLTGNSVTTNAQYNSYGNPTTVTKSYSNGPTETITNYYTNEIVDASHWLLGRSTSTSIQYTGSSPTITRSGTRVFDQNNNHLISETWYPGTNNQIINTYGYNSNGSLQSETATANGISRSKSYTYESDNIRIHSTTDQLSHVTTNSYDSYGRLSTQQDFLGNTVTFQYDNLGRQISVSTSDGNQSTTAYLWESPTSNPALARYSVLKTGNDGSQSKSWFDKLGRVIRSDVKGFDGTWIYTSSVYNTKGQIESVSEPYFSSGTAQLNTFTYDTYGRKSSQSSPSGRNSTWVYSNCTITETTSGKSFSKAYASDGTLSSASDAGGTINYSYYNDGKVKTITAPGSIVTSMQYDIAGNQTQLIDPSAGTSTYTYNGFGELLSQVNAKNQTTTISYNTEGTVSQKVTPEGTTTYTYNSNKQLTNISSPGNVSRSYGYDTKGRLITTSETIPGSSSFTTTLTYDAVGRKSTITHPSGITEINSYNSYGYLYSISAGGSVRWTTTGVNARQQVTSAQYGSNLGATFGYDSYGFPTSTTAGTIQNYSYNFNTSTGNINWRQNNKYSNLKEDFHYDNLDRLDDVYMGSTMYLDMSYDSNKGGIINKSDVGTLVYDVPGKPYAVSDIDPSTGLTPFSPQSFTYTSFERVETISENDSTALFTYNSDSERAKMVLQVSGNPTLTRWYPSSRSIKETSGSLAKEYTFIGGDAYSAPVIAITQNGTSTWYYLLRDYLGNITHIVNATNGTLYAEYSFDPWGRMRNPSTWENYNPGSEPELFVAGRGFTGHEHLPWFNLINMNGRIYDPLIGMFLSPDNYVQNPNLTQNYNRYAYCLNNPLKYTDPDGEIFWLIPVGIGALIGGWTGHRIGEAHGATGWDMAGYILGGALIGGASGGAALGVSAAGGGAMLAGAAAGAVGGGGFSGLAGNNVLTGAVNGALAGLVGGGVGAAIGGGLGALAGGASANLTGQLLYNGGDFSDVNWGSVGVSGVSSFGMYHAMMFANYQLGGKNLGGNDLSYRQFGRMSADFQRSRFWGKEYGGFLMNDGSVQKFPASWRHSHGITPPDGGGIDIPEGAFASYHTHWDAPGKEIWVDAFGQRVDNSSNPLDILKGHHTITARGHGAYDYGPIDSYVINRYGASFSHGGYNSSLPFSMPWFTRYFLFGY